MFVPTIDDVMICSFCGATAIESNIVSFETPNQVRCLVCREECEICFVGLSVESTVPFCKDCETSECFSCGENYATGTSAWTNLCTDCAWVPEEDK